MNGSAAKMLFLTTSTSWLPIFTITSAAISARRISNCGWEILSCSSGLLSSLKLLDVKYMGPILKAVKFEKDKRNISQQIIDQIISGNEKRYLAYQSLKAAGSKEDEERLKAISAFFSQWVPLEALLNRTTKRSSRSLSVFNINALKRTGLFDKDSLNQIAFLRKMRNTLIHDIEVPEISCIRELAEQARALNETLLKLLEPEKDEAD